MSLEGAADAIDGIDFLTLGPFPEGLARDLVARASRRVPVPCRLRARKDAALPRLGDRDQVDADRLLAGLEAEAGTGPVVLLGLTASDIGSPIWAFHFGRARLGGRAGLVSIARLSPVFYGLPDDPELTARRATAEILHEFGHAAGLHHCPDYACVMRVVTNVEGLDERSGAWCPGCVAQLPEDLRPRY